MRDDRVRFDNGESPRRLAEEPAQSNMARLLAAAARPVAVPRGARQRVMARLSQPRAARRWSWGVAGAVAAAASFALAWWVVRDRGEAPLARVAAVEGEVQVALAGGASVRAAAGAPVADGATVSTGAGGKARVELADVLVRVGAATRARLGRRVAGGVDIGLDHGEVDLTVDPRPAERAVVVSSRGYSVMVVGTVFRVRAPAEGGVAVDVSEGAVQVRGPGVTRMLRAGQSWSTPSPAAPDSPAPAPGAAPAAVTAGPSPSVAAPPPAKVPARPSRPARAVAVAAPPPSPPPRSEPPAPALAPAPAPAPPPAPVPARARSPQVRYQEAQSLVAAGRYQAAAAALGALADGGGAHGDLALFDRGLLLLRKMGDPAAARAAFLEHQRRFPSSALRPEADLWLIEASLAAGHLDEAARQIDQHLARHPDSERRDELLLTRGNLARDAGDCRRALRDYQRLVSRRGRVGEEALYFSAYCRRRLGDLAGARQQLGEYLERFPGGRHRQDAERSLAAPAKKL